MFGTNIKLNNLIFYISLELNVKSFLDHHGEKNGNEEQILKYPKYLWKQI